MSIAMQQVINSGQVREFGYNPITKRLTVIFKSGGYDYLEVPDSLYQEMVKQNNCKLSMGIFIATFVKNHFKFEKHPVQVREASSKGDIMKNDGGQAFPSPPIRNDAGQFIIKPQQGMSLRDYFAAHAPVDPQWWFQPYMPECPPHDWQSNDRTVKFVSAQEAEKALGEFGEFSDVNEEAISAWDNEQTKQRMLQWPYAWADEQLKQRYREIPVLTDIQEACIATGGKL